MSLQGNRKFPFYEESLLFRCVFLDQNVDFSHGISTFWSFLYVIVKKYGY